MTNKELITNFIRGERRYGVANHLGYSDDRLINYDTEICRIDRTNRTAVVNVRKYSNTTSRIQTQLKYQLSVAGYTITEYEGEPAYLWNCGYQGARGYTRREFKNKYAR